MATSDAVNSSNKIKIKEGETTIKHHIKSILPKHWHVNAKQEVLHLVDLAPTEPECIRIMQDIYPFLSKSTVRIIRIENAYSYTRFKLRQEEYENIGTKFELKQLYHATGKHKKESIVQNNLDWRKVKRARFGRGVSFSSEPAYSNLRCNWNNGIYRALLVCDVIVGNETIGGYNMKPVLNFDTTVDKTRKVFVKYAEDEFYPKYAIYYKLSTEMYETLGVNNNKLIKKYERQLKH